MRTLMLALTLVAAAGVAQAQGPEPQCRELVSVKLHTGIARFIGKGCVLTWPITETAMTVGGTLTTTCALCESFPTRDGFDCTGCEVAFTPLTP